MNSEDEDIALWARRLAGREEKEQDSPDAAMLAALREAIRKDDRAAQDAASNDEVGRARFMKRLEDEGLFNDQHKSASTRWRPWVAAAASILVVVLGSWHYSQTPQVVYRGVAGTVVVVSDKPGETAEDIIRQLNALGLKPRHVEGDAKITLEVDVTDDQLDAFYTWAADKNARAVTPGVYHVLIDLPGPDH